MNLRLDDAMNGDTSVTQADHQTAVTAAGTEGENRGKEIGRTEGSQAAYQRISAILGRDEVKGREAFAVDLACSSPNMSVDDVARITSKVPVATTAAATPTRQDRLAGTGVSDVQTGVGGPGPTGNQGQRTENAAGPGGPEVSESERNGWKTAGQSVRGERTSLVNGNRR